MGVTIRQKVKGKGQPWWVFIAHQGQRKSVRIGDKAAAEKVASALRERLKKGLLNLAEGKKAPPPSFQEASTKWLSYIEAMRKASTHERYDNAIKKHILPVFGEIRLDKITRGEIRDFLLEKFNEGLSKSSIGLLRDIVSGVFNFAIDEGLVKENPVTGITRRMQLKRERKEINPLAPDEIALVLETCKEIHPEHYPFFMLLARSGVRLGEALGLEWGDIDFNGRALWIRRSYRRGAYTTPKNTKARKVDMSDQLHAVLKAHMHQQKKAAKKTGKGELPALIFNRGGHVIEQNYIRRIFDRVLLKAGVRKVRIHDLRHSYASLLLSGGESVFYVKEQLGHSSINITVDRYGHWIPTEKKAGVNRLDEVDPSNL